MVNVALFACLSLLVTTNMAALLDAPPTHPALLQAAVHDPLADLSYVTQELDTLGHELVLRLYKTPTPTPHFPPTHQPSTRTPP